MTLAFIFPAASSCKQGWDWGLLARHRATVNKTGVLLVKKGRTDIEKTTKSLGLVHFILLLALISKRKLV